MVGLMKIYCKPRHVYFTVETPQNFINFNKRVQFPFLPRGVRASNSSTRQEKRRISAFRFTHQSTSQHRPRPQIGQSSCRSGKERPLPVGIASHIPVQSLIQWRESTAALRTSSHETLQQEHYHSPARGWPTAPVKGNTSPSNSRKHFVIVCQLRRTTPSRRALLALTTPQ